MVDWHKHHFRYDETTRRKNQNPKEILISNGLKKDMICIDLGSNDGFFTIPAAKIVGSKGKVYALDVNKEAVNELIQKAKMENLTNISASVGEAENFSLENVKADFVFLGMVLHDFYNPTLSLSNAYKSLKKGGKLVNFDWKKTDTLMGPPFAKRLSEEEVSGLLKKTGFTNIEVKSYSDNYYIITANT